MQTDTIQSTRQQDLKEEVIEEYIRRTDVEYDFTDFLIGNKDNRQPVNINKASVRTLKSLDLNDLQIANLKSYLDLYGELTSIYELNLVEGFDSSLILHLSPYLEFKLDPELHKITGKNLLHSGKHTILARYSRTLQKPIGYYGIEDSLTPVYAGNPDKLLFRYSFNYYDRLKIGVTMEKDPGESMKHGFDFYSLHFLYKSKKWIKTIALGNYNVTFGQGLTMSSGFYYISNPMTGIIQSKTNRVSSSTGANENSSLRGGAITINPIRNFDLTLFCSVNKLDALIYQDEHQETGGRYFTSIQESGLHRTAQEKAIKNSLNQKVYGGNLQYRSGILRIGGTINRTDFSVPMKPEDKPYRIFSFSGKNLTTYGTDLSLSFDRLIFYTEISADDQGGSAWLAGINSFYTDNFGLSIILRSYSPNYQNFFSKAFSSGSECVNETGFYAGFFTKLNRNVILTAGADHFRYPWLKYRIDAPSYGCEYNLQIRYEYTDKDLFSLKYSYSRKLINPTTNEDWIIGDISGSSEETTNSAVPIDTPVESSKHTFRLTLQYNPFKNLLLRNRFDILMNHSTKPIGKGYLMYQDIIFSPFRQRTTVNLRYALFQTDTYNERIYAYESDVLYSFSVPAYYNKGSRIYLMINHNINRNVSLWLRYSQTHSPQKPLATIGSEEITTSLNSEIRAQLVLKF